MNEPPLLEALAALGDDHTPRTHHRSEDGAPRFTNRLILETSPYLLQHAHNPVDWRPWGEEAFAEARDRDVPVFLSVGYSTCHWCHVMERESFEDLEIAAFVNARFVPVKLDREERPDVDAVFMGYVQVITGGGGWPMTVFLTPDMAPIFGGTYFPARDGDRRGAPGFLTVLRAIDERWRDPEWARQGREVFELLAARQAAADADAPGPAALDAAARGLLDRFDRRNGGFGRAPKFPRPSVLDLLLRRYVRVGDEAALEAVTRTLEAMACGGIRDHVAGGFARYSTDDRWLVPHFEKMLYDNAQLVDAYVEAHQVTGRALFAEVARDVLAYLDREMSDEAGGFHSATDADSEGEEGKFFVWTPAELDAVLGAEDGRFVRGRFGVTERGNFEGRSILFLEAPLPAEDAARWERLRPTLRRARAERVPPGLDDKVITAWNAMTISAFARAGLAFGDEALVARAVRAFDFVESTLLAAGAAMRSYRRGEARHPAVLEDVAAAMLACLDLVEATGRARFVDAALRLRDELSRFADPAGGFFRTAEGAAPLPFREKPDYDGAEPSGNAYAALALLRLSQLLGDDGARAEAERVVAALAGIVRDAPVAVPKLLCALDGLLHEGRVTVIVTPDEDRGAAAPLLEIVRGAYRPGDAVLVGPAGGALASRTPLFEDRSAIGGAATAYVCVGTTCAPPTTDPRDLARTLGAT